ncbi:MAG TPA: PAS domain-containing protein, partial [Spirochaetia bacterium]|nr:PAS domain-containing protein [Spirochaetia bacterium]
MDRTGKTSDRLDAQVRELRCLLNVSSILADRETTIDQLLPRVVRLIPPAYQYPGKVCVRIQCGDSIATSGGFAETPWEQSAIIAAEGKVAGSVQVCYLAETPSEAEGPFLEEERELIDAVGEMIGDRLEREGIAQRLHLQEERLQAVLDSAPVILWATDREGNLTSVSGRMLASLGMEPGRFVGRPVESFLEGSALIRDDARRALRGEHVLSDLAARGLTFESRVGPILDSTGKIDGVIGLLTDVTDRVQAESALKQTNRILEKVVSSTSFYMAFLDGALKVVRVNPAFAAALGASPASCAGISFLDLLAEADGQDLFHEVLRSGEPRTAQEKPFRLPVGQGAQTAYLDVDILPLDPGGQTRESLVVILVDRTLRRRATLELEKSRRELETLAFHLEDLREEERRSIAREIHDELGGLLTALNMDLSLIDTAPGSDPSAGGAALERAKSLVDKAVGMVRNIASSLRPQALDDFGLVVALEDLVEQFRRRAKIRCDLAISAEDRDVGGQTATAL